MYGGTHLQGDRRICTMCKQDFDSIYVAGPQTAKKQNIALCRSMAKGQRPYPEVSSTSWECPSQFQKMFHLKQGQKAFKDENISKLLCLNHLFHIQPVRLQPCAGVKCIVPILACLLRVSAIRSRHNGQLWRACGRGTLKSMPSLHRKQCSMLTLLPLPCPSSLANFSSIFTSLLHAAACTCSQFGGHLIAMDSWLEERHETAETSATDSYEMILFQFNFILQFQFTNLHLVRECCIRILCWQKVPSFCTD